MMSTKQQVEMDLKWAIHDAGCELSLRSTNPLTALDDLLRAFSRLLDCDRYLRRLDELENSV
jgi:hypothetical protein